MNSEMVIAGAQAIGSADKWGVVSVTIFFVMVILFVVGFFLWFIVKEIKKSVDGNTEAIKENGEISKEIARSLALQNENNKDAVKAINKISQKQDEIHTDIKELLRNARRKGNYNG